MTTRILDKKSHEPVARGDMAPTPDVFDLPRGWLFDGLGGFDRMFDIFMGRLPPMAGMEASLSAMPRMDVVETDKAFEVKMDLPGMDEADVKVTVRDGVLMLEADKKTESKEEAEGRTVHRSERRHESLARRIGLPDSVDIDKIEAHMDKGVITIQLPKRLEAPKEERKIEVKGA